MSDDTEKVIERAKELDRIATPGKWRLWSRDESGIKIKTPDGSGGMFSIAEVCSFDLRDENAAFIAESRTLLPRLVAEVEMLNAEVERIADACEIAKAPGFDRRPRIVEAIRNLWSAYHSNLRHGIQATDERDEAIERAKVPEWRPLSVLTMDAVKQHAGAWALRSGPAGLPELRWLIIETMPPDYKTLGICCPDNEGSKIPNYITECRPVDSEVIPVPWAKVGL
jgi:hypothetical protein